MALSEWGAPAHWTLGNSRSRVSGVRRFPILALALEDIGQFHLGGDGPRMIRRQALPVQFNGTAKV